MSFFVVQCSDDHHPSCGLTHIWYYDAPLERWLMHDGTAFVTREEAERVAFELSTRHEQIMDIAILEKPCRT